MRSIYSITQLVAIAIGIYPFLATNIFGFRKYDNAEATIFVFVAIILFLACGTLYRLETRRIKAEKQFTSCPHCAEDIRVEAKLCKHCGKAVGH